MKTAMLKRAVLIFTAVLISVLTLCACQSAQKDDVLTVVHATDMHFLSPELTDYGEGFIDILTRADGKVTQYSPQLCEAFAADMLALHPDAVILSGDLTLNGAPASHNGLAAVLAPLHDAGISVFVLPGNHDTGGTAYSFSGSGVERTEALSDADFSSVYADFGYNDATSRDPASQSYAAEISPKLLLLLIDINSNDTAGKVRDETLAWAEQQLSSAKENGAAVIAVTHQPLLVHNRLFTFGYTAIGGEKLLSLFEEYGVSLNLCGHLHIQHIAKEGDFVEIAGSSMAVAPNQYGVLTIKNGVPQSYRTASVNVAEWALSSGETNPELLDFASFSAGFFDLVTEKQVSAMLEESTATAEEKASMTAFAVRLNAEYFGGRRTLSADDPAWALWQKYMPQSFFKIYMSTILEEPAADMCSYNFSDE